MKHIDTLLNLGENKTALLIGNGHSAKTFDYSCIDLKYTFVFGINRIVQPIRPDFVIHYDKLDDKQKEEFKHRGDTDIISLDLNSIDGYSDYCYKPKDIIFCDSGNHLLQIVSNVMKFETIYLIGYDYHTATNKLRTYDEENYTQNEFKTYDDAIFKRALHRYYKPKCRCSNKTLFNLVRDYRGMFKCSCEEENIFQCKKIYNLNPDSALKLFKYIDIKEEICQIQ